MIKALEVPEYTSQRNLRKRMTYLSCSNSATPAYQFKIDNSYREGPGRIFGDSPDQLSDNDTDTAVVKREVKKLDVT